MHDFFVHLLAGTSDKVSHTKAFCPAVTNVRGILAQAHQPFMLVGKTIPVNDLNLLAILKYIFLLWSLISNSLFNAECWYKSISHVSGENHPNQRSRFISHLKHLIHAMVLDQQFIIQAEFWYKSISHATGENHPNQRS